MRSLFSARSFADRAAARLTGREAPDEPDKDGRETPERGTGPDRPAASEKETANAPASRASGPAEARTGRNPEADVEAPGTMPERTHERGGARADGAPDARDVDGDRPLVRPAADAGPGGQRAVAPPARARTLHAVIAPARPRAPAPNSSTPSLEGDAGKTDGLEIGVADFGEPDDDEAAELFDDQTSELNDGEPDPEDDDAEELIEAAEEGPPPGAKKRPGAAILHPTTLKPIPHPGTPEMSGGSPRAPANARPTGALLTPQPPDGTLRLLPLQALAKGGRWRTEAMRSYRMPLLLWFTRGQGRITVSGFTRGYGAHNAVFVPARAMHGFEVTAQVYGTAVFFAEGTTLPLPDRPVHLRVRDAMAQGEVTTILEQLGREIDGDRPLRTRAIHHHAGLLTVWLDRQIAVSDDARPNNAALRLVRRYTEAVEAQLYTGQGVGDYAEALGVTPTHLSRVCRETCGRSASDILADRVTYEARRLLAETTLPVKQVAQILGYGSAAYFTRAFQNRTGQTPTQFRSAR